MGYSPAQKRAYWARKNKKEAERKANKKPFVRLAAPSCLQQAVFDEIANGTECFVVDAVAGSGKTTTLLNGLFYIPRGKSACYCAFGRDIADELSDRCPVEGIAINTSHSFGGAAIRRRWRYARLDKFKLNTILVSQLGDPYANPEKTDEDLEERIEQVKKAVSLSKQCLAHDADSISDLIEDYSLDFLLEDERKKKLDDAALEIRKADFIQLVLRIQNICKADTNTYDFDDMIWFPVVYNLSMDQFDLVLIDETQDFNKCQIELVLMMIKPGGRIGAVGDERQAIYLFRGADQFSMRNLVERLNAKRLPLSITYRCAKRIVQYVKDNVTNMEHLTAADDSPDGEVEDANFDTLLEEIQAGDFIVSRMNATNVSLAIYLTRHGKPCNIRGKDLGDYFRFFIKRSKCKDLPSFLDYIQTWEQQSIENLHKRKKKPSNLEAMIENIQDRAACMTLFAENCLDMKEMLSKIQSLFTDQKEDKIIILGTTHKLKGLERDRVWMLHSTFKPGKTVEEDNLFYVAATRAKRSLKVVRGLLRDKK